MSECSRGTWNKTILQLANVANMRTRPKVNDTEILQSSKNKSLSQWRQNGGISLWLIPILDGVRDNPLMDRRGQKISPV